MPNRFDSRGTGPTEAPFGGPDGISVGFSPVSSGLGVPVVAGLDAATVREDRTDDGRVTLLAERAPGEFGPSGPLELTVFGTFDPLPPPDDPAVRADWLAEVLATEVDRARLVAPETKVLNVRFDIPQAVSLFGSPREVFWAGDDRVVGTRWEDTIEGAEGDDFLIGRASRDNLGGGAGSDTVKGGGGDDFLFGNAGDDRVLGGRGSDYINLGGGNDTAIGGAGYDYLLATYTDTAERKKLVGNGGDDRIEIGLDGLDEASLSGDPVTLRPAIKGGGGIDTLVLDLDRNGPQPPETEVDPIGNTDAATGRIGIGATIGLKSTDGEALAVRLASSQVWSTRKFLDTAIGLSLTTRSVEKAEVFLDEGSITEISPRTPEPVFVIGEGAQIVLGTSLASSLSVIFGIDMTSAADTRVTLNGSTRAGADMIDLSALDAPAESTLDLVIDPGRGADNVVLGPNPETIVLRRDGARDEVEGFDPAQDSLVIEGLNRRNFEDLDVSVNRRGLLELSFQDDTLVIDNRASGPDLGDIAADPTFDALGLLGSSAWFG